MSTATKTALTAKTAKPKLDLRELQQKQLNGEEIEMTAGNADDAGDYEFPSHESDRVHVELTKKVNDPILKQYTDEVTRKKFVPAQFDRMVRSGYFDTTTYDKVRVLHDPRYTKSAPASTAPTGARPWEPAEGLPTLQDAQMRYKELYGQNAPAVSYESLLEFIQAKELEVGQYTDEPNGGTAPGPRKAIRSTVDAQERYKELFGEDAPADKSFTELKVLIENEENRLDEEGGATR